jgi:hypothetical protein
MKNDKTFTFSVVEEMIMNTDFIKEHPGMMAGRIEIFMEGKEYDVEEIRLLLPTKMFEKIRDALDCLFR